MSDSMQPKEKVGRRLAAAIAYRGACINDLAEQAGVNRQTLWRYTKGHVEQPFIPMARLAAVLGVKLDYLAYGIEPMADTNWPEDAF